MQKLQDSVFTLVKTTNLAPAVFSFLQPTHDSGDKTPLGGILKDTKHGWLALGPKFCVVDLRTGMKVAARTFGATLSNNATVTSVVELPTPLTENSQQLIISLQCDDISTIVILNINGSQVLRCIQTDVVVTQLTICDNAPDGIFTCFDGVVIAGTKRGEVFAFDLNRSTLIQALKNISQGYEDLVQNELKPTNLSFLPLDAIHRIDEQRELALQNDHHLAVLLNENSFIDAQYIFRNPDGSVRMKAKRDHIRVTVLEYIPQTGSVAAGFNFGAFQLWNLMNLDLEFTSQVNVECLPVTHFGFQEPCDDPRAFCYLWVIFSAVDKYEEEEFPLAVMYSLTYQGKRMLSDTKCLYQDFTSATIRFQVELSNVNDAPLLGGKCISCHTYSIKSSLGDEGEDNMLNLCQLVWECWAENANSPMQYGMLLFDLDQWYKDQMPSTYRVQSNAFLSASSWTELSGGGSVALHARLDPASVTPYSHATRLEEHFYPNSLQFNCICLNTSEVCMLGTIGIQRQIISSLEEAGPTALLHPARLYAACASCGLAPLYAPHSSVTQEEQRRYLLSVALEARLSRFLKRCAHDWATGTHSGVGCTLPFLVDWCWQRAIELKENAKELTAPLFISSSLPDRNIVRCLEHCVQQLTQLTGLMDAILTKCCNLVVPDALSEMEEKHKGIGTVSLYFQVVQWFLRVGLLPERVDGAEALPYPAVQLYGTYNKRRLKLNRIQDNGVVEENSAHKSCVLLYIDQLLEQEFGGERIHQMWINGGSECRGLYPPPSLYALLRLYLLPDIAEEHKHSLVLYLLVDYSMIYDDVRYEIVIRRLMQFPTMFGLSNTAIKATQAFWHLDHRDFDFALDQLQCLTGNTLSQWQHNVVLSSLLAQKKTQAALQYLHVRKPAPIKNVKDGDHSRINDYDKLEDWQSCCNLYLARGLVYEALDVIRMCVQNAGSLSDKTQVLNIFFKGCRNTGNLSKILSVSFSPLEEEVFIKYLENCNEPPTSDVLIMYYLQQSRYLEAERYNNKLRLAKPKTKDITASAESLFDSDRECARDHLVEAMCAAIPSIAETVAHCAFDQKDFDWHVNPPNPMSMYVKAKTSINSFTYKSSFIQDTIQNASETWMNRPRIRKGMKRMLNIEETPFICTPKLSRSRSTFTDAQSESTPPKRARLNLNLTGTPRTPRSSLKVSHNLSAQMEKLLDMPEVQSPVGRYERPETPHSILKLRRNSRCEVPSPTGSRYLEDTDDELEMETASNHTHYSDTTNKHLRFTIPTPTELCTDTTPSPTLSRMTSTSEKVKERERSASTELEREQDISTAESYVTTASHAMNESNPLESPPKKLATEENVSIKRSYKDSVRARRSLSISANSSLTDDPNTSIESIADIPITLINPRYSGNRRRSQSPESRVLDAEKYESETQDAQFTYAGKRDRRSMSTESTRGSVETRSEDTGRERESMERLEVPKTPRGRRGIRASGESTPLRSGSLTPERQDSPIITPMRSSRICRSRSKTPELSPRSSPLPPIMEQPRQEIESEPHAGRSTLSVPRSLRSRSRTPERMDKGVSGSPKLEVIKESPTKSAGDSPPASPSRRSLRSRSRTPDQMDKGVSESPKLEAIKESPTTSVGDSPPASPSRRSLRRRSRTPERMDVGVSESPKLDVIKESPTKSVGDSPPSSPSRRSLRSRSHTPERMDIGVSESPKLEAIKESPTKFIGHSPPASPSRSSLRSRSRTPEVEVVQEQVIKPKPINLRSRSKTPEKLMSPKREHSVRTKKSLSRLVLEANTFAKTKQTLELLEAESSSESRSESTETKETALECTPMKTLKQVPSLMDVTLSPIVNKSVLQSSNDSVLSETVEKQPKDSDNSDVNLIPSPAFAPLQETYFGKSVLHSYQSSDGQTSTSITEEKETTKSVDFVPMPAFKTIHEDFGRSVLHSYESSDAECSQSSTQETPIKDETKPFSIETPINLEFGSVLDSSCDDSQQLDISSLITDDSDVEMTETENQERAEQKEKEQIVEIEREIHEIEDMSNENESEEDSSDESSEESDAETIDSSDSSIHASSADSDSASDEPSARDLPGQPPIVPIETLYKIMEEKFQSTSKTAEDSDASSRSKVVESASDESETNDSESEYSSSKKTGSDDSNQIDVDSDSDQKEKLDDELEQIEIAKSEEVIAAKMEVTINQEQISMITDDNSVLVDAEIEVSTPVEVTNLLDQAQISLMTDDNSTIIDDAELAEPVNTPVGPIEVTSTDKEEKESEKQKHEVETSQLSEKQTKISEQIGTKIDNKPLEKVIDPLAQVSLMTDDNSQLSEKQTIISEQIGTKIDNKPLEKVVDPLAQVSLMTDDNSESEQELSLNYSDEKIEMPVEEKAEVPETKLHCDVIIQDVPKPEPMVTKIPSPVSMDVVDTSASDTEIKEAVAVVDKERAEKMDTQSVPKILKPENTQEASKSETVQTSKTDNVPEISKLETKNTVEKMAVSQDVKESKTESTKEVSNPEIIQEQHKLETIVESIKPVVVEKIDSDSTVPKASKPTVSITESVIKTKLIEESIVEKMDTDTEAQTSEQEPMQDIRTRKRVKSTSSNSDIEAKDVPKTPATRRRSQSRAKSTDVENPKIVIEEPTTSVSEIEPKTPITRKRAKSIAKTTEIEIPEEGNEPTNFDVPKTPSTRKRSAKADDETFKVIEATEVEPKTPITRKRTQSNQSEETTPETTPSRRKAPNTEVRKIITRRMSREMKELDESLTPKRLATIVDDNESVVSGSSMASTVEGKKRGRKSTVATKPDLSVIPETFAEGEHSTLEVPTEYSDARRLTRNQERILKSSRGRRPSNTSHYSWSSVSELDEEERKSAFDVQPMDRISLLNKESYEGPPDEEELRLSSMSPESIASDASKMRSRMARAASETKVVKAAKIHRRIASVDVAGDSPMVSPALSGADSPARNRRASFNRAIEALHTPKGRRQSTDSRKSEVGSPLESPVTSETEALTPSRRGRRLSSNTSQTGRTRTKKMPVLEEVKETKK